MNRREMIRSTAAAALGLGLAGCAWRPTRTPAAAKKILFFSKSSGYEHAVIKRNGAEPSFAEKVLAGLDPKHSLEFSFSKDGSLFTPEYLAQFDAYLFYTTGDLTTPGTDKNPPMTPAGKAALLSAVNAGKGFIGAHTATDTFHPRKPAGTGAPDGSGKTDPYLRMIGGEFTVHAKQQKAKMRVADRNFPGLRRDDFELLEEWYSFKDFAPDLHVLLVQETAGMDGKPYQRPPYPATWARRHGKGRVFYTSLGHREDVWTNPIFQEILLGGISWALGRVNADVTPNLIKVTPGCAQPPPA
jgi:uncharacterized protein